VADPSRITELVYWLPPGPPDRPSLCAVAGERGTIWLDAGASAAHAREFAAFLADQGVGAPSHVVLTHSHWDHVFGAAELGAHVVAHERTGEYLGAARRHRLERRGARSPRRGGSSSTPARGAAPWSELSRFVIPAKRADPDGS
jgi:glyoxylase-like metal-dependent hydrolase (beta-lactamase superfamily II)